MDLPAHGHLRKVRDHDHLVRAREVGQHVGQRHGGRATHTGIHLVEHKRAHLVCRAQHHFHGQHHAAHLAARRDARKRARPHAGAGAEQKLHRLRTRARPLRAVERTQVAHKLGAAHLQTRHLLRDGGGEGGGGFPTRCGQSAGRLRKRRLGRVARASRGVLALGRVVHQRHQVGRLLAFGQHIGHARAVCAQKALERRHALLLLRERLRVELHVVAVVARLAGHVLQHVARLAQRFGERAERGVVARRPVERGRGRVQGVERAALPRKRLVRDVRGCGQSLGVLHAREVGRQLVVLALARTHRVDAREHEARLVELRRRRLARLAHPVKLGRRVRRLGKRLLVRLPRRRDRLARPRVEHPHMRRRLHKPLMLVLAAQIDRRRHRIRQLAHAGHAPVDAHARPSVGPHAAHRHQLGRGIGRIEPLPVKPPRHHERVLAVAHGPFVGALAHEQFERGKQRRLARARLAREHGQPTRRLERRAPYERKVLNLDLVDHRTPLAASCFVDAPVYQQRPPKRGRSTRTRAADTALTLLANGRWKQGCSEPRDERSKPQALHET